MKRPQPAALAEVKSEAWVKEQVKKIFAEFGCFRPYMPVKTIYGASGGADFIECMFGRYIAVETKRKGKKPTKLQLDFGLGVAARGGEYFVCYEYNLGALRSLFRIWESEWVILLESKNRS